MDFVTVQEVADAVGRTTRAVRYACEAGKLSATKHGRDWLIPAKFNDPDAYRAAVEAPKPSDTTGD